MDMADRVVPGDPVIEADVGAVRAILAVAPPGPELCAALDQALATSGVRALALFLSSPGNDEDAAAAIAALDSRDTPCVAGVSGHVIGAALALALACDEIVANPAATFALPEVRAGLLPVLGTTQRLPRRIGAAAALRLMLTGQVIDAAEAIALGLIDRVAEGDLADPVLARAADLAARHQRRHPVAGLRDPVAFQAAVAAARSALRDEPMPAPARIVDCVESALLLPPEQGLAFETTAREDLLASEEAAGLAHAFRVEDRLARIAPGRGSPAPRGVAIWGTGGVALPMARLALTAGLRVALCAPAQAELAEALDAVARWQQAEVQAGRLSPATRDSDWVRLTPWLEPVAEDSVILCPGADAWQARAERVSVAVHDAREAEGAAPSERLPRLALAAPPGAMPAPGAAVEIVSTGPQATRHVAPGGALLLRLGLVPVATGQGGPVALQLRAALAAAIVALEEEGHSRAAVAAALADRGMIGGRRRPPSQLTDPTSAEIVARCQGAIANAGARLVQSGAVPVPAVVDALALAARLYPRWMGGPMHRADRIGLPQLRDDLARWSSRAPRVWTPAALVERLAAEGRRFDDLNAVKTA